MGTISRLKAGMDQLPAEQQEAQRLKQGWPHILTDLRIIDVEGKALPHDGKAFGELQARGAHTVSQYYKVRSHVGPGAPRCHLWQLPACLAADASWLHPP